VSETATMSDISDKIRQSDSAESPSACVPEESSDEICLAAICVCVQILAREDRTKSPSVSLASETNTIDKSEDFCVRKCKTQGTVEPPYNEGPGDWQNMCAITRFRYIEVLFHIFYYY